jgi:hypothetical protein
MWEGRSVLCQNLTTLSRLEMQMLLCCSHQSFLYSKVHKQPARQNKVQGFRVCIRKK